MSEETAKKMILALAALKEVEEMLLQETMLANDLRIAERPDAEKLAKQATKSRERILEAAKVQIEEMAECLGVDIY